MPYGLTTRVIVNFFFYENSKSFTAPNFTKLTKAEQHYVQMSFIVSSLLVDEMLIGSALTAEFL